jgi:hypothetical protein
MYTILHFKQYQIVFYHQLQQQQQQMQRQRVDEK